MPLVKRVDPELSRYRSIEEGRDVIAYNYSWDDLDGTDPFPEGGALFLTGPVDGAFRTSDGMVYDIAPEVIVVHKPEHQSELLAHIEGLAQEN